MEEELAKLDILGERRVTDAWEKRQACVDAEN